MRRLWGRPLEHVSARDPSAEGTTRPSRRRTCATSMNTRDSTVAGEKPLGPVERSWLTQSAKPDRNSVRAAADPIPYGSQAFVIASRSAVTRGHGGTSHGALVARCFRTCRRLLWLIYATAVVYFFYAPWNYFLLGILLLRQQSTKIGVDVSRTPHPQTKNFQHAGRDPFVPHSAIRFDAGVWRAM
jgi:hypothetical protein